MEKIMQKNQYYPWFDWLRAVLAIAVMFTHEGLSPWNQSGNFAVQVFFALSGWLIGGILLKISLKDLPRFYFNRALRIWAPYYIALLLLITASLLKEPITLKWLEFIFYKFTFVYNIFGPPQLAQYSSSMPLHGTGNHFWSVNAEEQFYLLAPFLLVLIPYKFGKSTLLWVLIAALAWYTNTYASIIFGVLAAVAVREFGQFHQKTAVKIVLLLACAICIYLLQIDFYYVKTAPVIAIAIILLLAQSGNQSKWGEIAGGMSYQLYLNHWIGIFAAHALLSPFGLRDSSYAHIISFILNVCFAVTMYWFVDKRIHQGRAQWFSHSRGIVAIVLAYSMILIGSIGGYFLVN